MLDALRDVRPPYSPAAVTSDFAALCKTYGIREVTGDRYAGEFPRELWRTHGLAYRLSELSKSDIYRELIPSLNAYRVTLLDNRRLQVQLLGLERRTNRGTGKDVIDHGPLGKDDAANAACGALLACVAGKKDFVISDAAVSAFCRGAPGQRQALQLERGTTQAASIGDVTALTYFGGN